MKTVITRSSLVRALRSDPDRIPATLSERQVTAVVTDLFNLIHELVGSGEPVRLTGIGTLTPVIKLARQRRNPQTGKPVSVPTRWGVKLKPASGLTDLLNANCELPDLATESAEEPS